MAFLRGNTIKKFDKKVWLATPTMHGEELKYIMEAYETNWMSTAGENINEVFAADAILDVDTAEAGYLRPQCPLLRSRARSSRYLPVCK